MLVARRAWLSACLLTACASGGVPAPSDPASLARARRIALLRVELAAPDEQRRAWAAWNAGEEGLVELVPELIEDLELEAAKPSDWKWPTCASASLDALIRLDARVPATTLAPFVASPGRCQQIPACILAAREPSANVDALESAQRSFVPDVGFLAAHVLALGNPRGAVMRALRDATVVVRVQVIEAGVPEAAEKRNPSGLVIHADPGDPPIAVYSVVRKPTEGETRLAGLPGELGYLRATHSERVELGLTLRSDMRGGDGAALLRGLARVGVQELGLRLETSATTLEELEALALPALEAQLAAWKSVMQSLLAQGLIDPSMTQMRAPVRLQCEDRRRQQESSLIKVFAPLDAAWRRRLAELGEFAHELDAAELEGLRRDLGSNQLDRRAWAAFAASEGKLAALAPELRASLAGLESVDKSDARVWTLRNLLDALIGLRVPVDSRVLAGWERQGVDTELLLLAANDPARCTDFLAHCVAEPIPYKRHDLPWLAASNLLSQADPKRAVAIALKDLRVTLDVHVLDDPNQRVRGPSSNEVYGDGGPPEISECFPPFAYYTLDSAAAGGAVLGQRHATANGQASFHYREYDAHSARLEILRSLACSADTNPVLTGYVHVKQVWSRPEALLEEVRARRAALHSEWKALLDALDARGLLDPSDRGRELPLQLRIQDLRHDMSGPFPDLET